MSDEKVGGKIDMNKNGQEEGKGNGVAHRLRISR